ncbi:recombinase family protein [Pontibacter diazotrophicus]|uniref:Recombinase family protein n=1 Tax=Pontibacter diazotrophicus TaxID=1400979 RepID=A0A3D8L3M4_9BACT|nr:recombinase family protein [Pontibacter diazotrophicus]RDV11913.1 recombinase family protein [Pontibacter diazotrophicus]
MKIGYARVSTQDQKLELQLDALTQHGCGQIFREKKSGKSKERPELEKMISQLRSGDTVVVWKLDRLGRSLRDLIDLVSEFKERGVEFVSLQDGINTATPTGRFTFNIFASLAEFEREIIRERTKAGLDSAKTRGRKGGRPVGLSKAAMEKAKSARILFDSGTGEASAGSQLLTRRRHLIFNFRGIPTVTMHWVKQHIELEQHLLR